MTSTLNIFGDQLTSTRKRKREEYAELLIDLEKQTARRHEEIVEEVREGNKHRAQLVGFVVELVSALKSSLAKN